MKPNLDDPCRQCGEPIGDHTLRKQWEVCLPQSGHSSEFTAFDGLQMALPAGTLIADDVIVKTLVAPIEGIGNLPILHFRFGINEPGPEGLIEPTEVATVAFLSSLPGLSEFSRLIRQSLTRLAGIM